MKDNRLVHMVVFSLLITLFFHPAKGFAKDKVQWLITHWPPLMELDKSKSKIIGGQYGGQLKLLQESLTDYEHINQDMKWNRFWIVVEQGQHVCNCMAYKNEKREKFAEFSIPITIVLPNHIIVRKDTMEMLGNPESLSIVELLRDRRLKGALLANRSYSHDIDRLLLKHEKNSNIERIVVSESSSIRMLYNKRMDYILEYPFVINNTINKYMPEYKGGFRYIPIREIAQFYYVYVACPKNEWGKNLVGKINDSLKSLRPTKEFRRQMEYMYAGEQLQTVWGFYDNHLLKVNE